MGEANISVQLLEHLIFYMMYLNVLTQCNSSKLKKNHFDYKRENLKQMEMSVEGHRNSTRSKRQDLCPDAAGCPQAWPG